MTDILNCPVTYVDTKEELFLQSELITWTDSVNDLSGIFEIVEKESEHLVARALTQNGATSEHVLNIEDFKVVLARSTPKKDHLVVDGIAPVETDLPEYRFTAFENKEFFFGQKHLVEPKDWSNAFISVIDGETGDGLLLKIGNNTFSFSGLSPCGKFYFFDTFLPIDGNDPLKDKESLTCGLFLLDDETSTINGEEVQLCVCASVTALMEISNAIDVNGKAWPDDYPELDGYEISLFFFHEMALSNEDLYLELDPSIPLH